MDVLPADAEMAVDHAGLSSCNAVAHGADPTELLDIDMDELAWLFPLIASDRLGRLQGTQLIQAQPTQNAADGGWRDADLVAICLPVQRWRRNCSISSMTAWDVGRCHQSEYVVGHQRC